MAYDPLGLDESREKEEQGYDPLGLGVAERPPSYGEAIKTGLRESIYGGLRKFEAPFKPLARELGIPPGLEASELFKPSEEELRKPYTIPQQVVRGLAGIPATVASYAPFMAALGPVGGFVAPELMETISEGKPISEIAKRTAEATVLGTAFKFLPKSLRYRVPSLGGLFGAQALYETGEPREAIAPAIVGAGMSLLGREKVPRRIPLPEPEVVPERLRISPIPESRYMMGTPGFPSPEELPYPPVPYRRGGPMEAARKVEIERVQPGLPLTPEEKAKFATGERPTTPLGPEDFQRVSDTYSKENSPTKRIVDKTSDIPERILRQIPLEQRERIQGVYDPAERLTYLVRENIRSEAELKDIIDHEDIKHYAVDEFFKNKGDVTSWFNRVYLKYGRSGLKDIAEERGLDLNTPEGRLEAAREKIARTPIDEPGVIKQFWAWLREKLSKIFPDMKISDAEIQRTFQQAREAMERGEFRAREKKVEGLRRQVRGIYNIPKAEFATGVPPTSDINRLSEELNKVTKPETPLRQRFGIAQDLNSKISGMKTGAEDAVNKLKANWSALVDWFRKPGSLLEKAEKLQAKPWTDYKNAKGKYIGDMQFSEYENSFFAKKIQNTFPENKQEAISRWIEASGDENQLRDWATRSMDPRFKKIYQEALNLTEEEKSFGRETRQYWDSKLDQAIEVGMFDHGLEDFVTHIYKKDPSKARKIFSQIDAGMFRKNPYFAKQRFYQTFFDAEQAGLIPEGRIGYLVTAYEKAFDNALLTRQWLKSMLDGSATDGRPLVITSGGGKPIPPNEVIEAYLINATSVPKESWDYKHFDHPALKNWKWATSDELGQPIFVEGNLLLHPEIFKDMKNILSRSAIRENAFGRVALSGVATLKGTLLSISGFHQVQEGTHAIFHKVNAFKAPPLEELMRSPLTKELAEHGMQLYHGNAIYEFGEGLASGGLLNRLPAVGPFLQRYGEYLFENYIPRLKIKMAHDAFDRNITRFGDRMSRDQILELTGRQADAAFGELNYKWMGRNQTMQDIFRLMTLAPDFLEARARFFAQAFTPLGREQAAALIRGALGMIVAAQVMNVIFSDEHKPYWDKPFSLVIHGKEYTLRSVPGDFYHLISGPRSFIYYRLNPTTTRTMLESITGRDQYGNKIDPEDQIADFIRSHIPIPLQGFFNKRDQTIIGQVLQSMGVGSWKYKSPAEREASDILYEEKMPKGKIDPEQRKRSRLVRDYIEQYRDAEKRLRPLSPIIESVQKDLSEGRLRALDIKRFREGIAKEDLEVMLKTMTLKQALRIWEKANDEEKKKIAPYILRKFRNQPREEKEILLPKVQEIAGEMR